MFGFAKKENSWIDLINTILPNLIEQNKKYINIDTKNYSIWKINILKNMSVYLYPQEKSVKLSLNTSLLFDKDDINRRKIDYISDYIKSKSSSEGKINNAIHSINSLNSFGNNFSLIELLNQENMYPEIKMLILYKYCFKNNDFDMFKLLSQYTNLSSKTQFYLEEYNNFNLEEYDKIEKKYTINDSDKRNIRAVLFKKISDKNYIDLYHILKYEKEIVINNMPGKTLNEFLNDYITQCQFDIKIFKILLNTGYLSIVNNNKSTHSNVESLLNKGILAAPLILLQYSETINEMYKRHKNTDYYYITQFKQLFNFLDYDKIFKDVKEYIINKDKHINIVYSIGNDNKADKIISILDALNSNLYQTDLKDLIKHILKLNNENKVSSLNITEQSKILPKEISDIYNSIQENIYKIKLNNTDENNFNIMNQYENYGNEIINNFLKIQDLLNKDSDSYKNIMDMTINQLNLLKIEVNKYAEDLIKESIESIENTGTFLKMKMKN